jgi:geranylgeranyl pyrophosphate synthase
MDDDELRRGKPTCHVVFGEANALLAGDALQAMAFEILARTRVPSRYSPHELLKELACAAGSRGVVGGQVEDLAIVNKRPTAALMRRIHLHKTADLFKAATRMGAIAANAGKRELQALTDYGTCVGLAFQITDDILDGSPRSGDKRNRDKSSCLAVYGFQTARQKARALIQKAISSLQGLRGNKNEPLIALAKFINERMY